jgi:hypothetical protein
MVDRVDRGNSWHKLSRKITGGTAASLREVLREALDAASIAMDIESFK